MSRLSVICFFAVMGTWIFSQTPVKPCSHPNASQFDFWVGSWELTWPGGQMQTPADQIGKGTNFISKTLDGCVTYEQFSMPQGNFNGRSFSVYSPSKNLWQQTWVDNQGGYLIFTGSFNDGKMELRTPVTQRSEKKIVSRMVFRNIERDSFDWDWQRSSDGGKTWVDLWNIHYQRVD